MRIVRFSTAVLMLASCLLSRSMAGQQITPSVQRRIVQAVDDKSTALIPNTTHLRIHSARDLGHASGDLPMNRILMMLKGSPEQDAELEQLLAQQQDPSSALFHQWLTPGQFGERFGASLEDIAVITTWLHGQGFRVDRIGNGRREIEFSGTLTQVETAFHTEVHSYETNGTIHTANATDISIPQALAPVVKGLVSLNDFPVPSMSRVRPDDNFTSGAHGIAPYDFATIYDVAPLWNKGIDGTGQSIAIVGRTNINLSDVTFFRSKYGLPVNNPQVILNGADPGIVSASEEGEADLDVEWSGAVAKGAAIKFVVSGKTSGTDGVVLSAAYIVDNNTAPILSMSFGTCEADSLSAAQYMSGLWQQGAAQGISVVVSSGDSGAAGCDDASSTSAVSGLGVNGAAATPYNVGVGGTLLNENGNDSTYWNSANTSNYASVKSYIPEVAWNESGSQGLWSGGGGVSTVFAAPSWQTGLGVPTVDPGTNNQHHRYVPDVSLSAGGHDGYVLIQEGALELVSGTSASAPSFAGILAMINQSVSSAIGNPSPGLYSIAAKNPTAFHDITSGNNSVPCKAGSSGCANGTLTGYSATAGYDLVTGWGSVDASVLVNAWSSTTGVVTPLGPLLTITSPTAGVTVSTTTITVSGTATDAGRGGNGVASVTVNGVAAANDTASGSGTANWSSTVSLSNGSNTITVVVTDNSTQANSTTQSIAVTLSIPVTTTPVTSTTASTNHLFPQFADGQLGDGTYYQTTLMISNPSSTIEATCSLQLHGLTLPDFKLSYTLGGGGWVIAATSGTAAFQSGYATLQCTASVEAQLLYSLYLKNGTKLSEATVFSSPSGSNLLVICDEREGAQLGIAIANDTDQTASYTILGGGVAGPTLTLGPRSSIAKYADQLVPSMPANALSVFQVIANTGTASVIGLRFTGNVFTTIPEIEITPAGATANTYHVFPEFADGKFGDGTYYKTTRMYLNPSATSGSNCTTLLQGLTTDGISTIKGSLSAATYIVSSTNGTQAFQAGYATMQCTGVVDAQALYSFYGSNGVKLSEATVFSSPSAAMVQILADNRGGSQVGLAIANDSDQPNTYTITVDDVNAHVVGTASLQLGPRSSVAKFVSEFMTLPANFYGRVLVTSSTGTASIIGLRFTGSIFTTIPQTIR